MVDRVALVLRAAGFRWAQPGYWSLVAGDVEITLEPQIMNAGDYKLGLYWRHRPMLKGELLVDVKPRPRGRR